MIKLIRPSCPPKLTTAERKKLTAEYVKKGTSVWRKPYITERLLSMSKKKCCYCECKVNVEGSYFEVEHFYHKKKHPKKVVEWTNLLPSCKRCNLHKGEHDVKKTPIIDPAQVNPKKHLYFRDYRINGKTTLGKKTVTVLQLNETDKVVMKRYTVGQEVYERLQDILNDINVFVSNSVGNKNRIQNRFKELLKAAYPDCAYCASNSTIIFNSPDFKEIKKQFKSIGLWDTELGKLEKIISSFALSCK